MNGSDFELKKKQNTYVIEKEEVVTEWKNLHRKEIFK
jgi:hypothetical protein